MKIKIEVSEMSDEQQEAHMNGWFVQDIKKFCEENVNGLGLKLGLDEGSGMSDGKRTLLFSNEANVFATLKELQNQRNKLNRKITKLKQKTLEKPNLEPCYCCELELPTEEYSQETINQQWAEKSIGQYMTEETCWLCKFCKQEESKFDSHC